MEGNVGDEKLDLSRCEDEAVAKERMKRRAGEGQEEDVDGNRSRAKTLFRHIGSAAGELEFPAYAILQEVGDSKYEELFSSKRLLATATQGICVLALQIVK